ncbi:hypothetical protein H1230_12850 [Paenibacillus sp. 19GGS1-52]|uniref:hypothetical protein n=1 Tax=Paenibacillus sp. 19GGS1-52 TaxID=2758563 RepID=UPI001EFC2BA2|nr:hypothetical protein [Paenibacillus sp. 19GGS1-52]ULO09576.1 hypothetical protein H1230_12850 [Paenibacillus sp. 19GGS1-52]
MDVSGGSEGFWRNEVVAFKARFHPIVIVRSGNRALTAIVRTLRTVAALLTTGQLLILALSWFNEAIVIFLT